MLEQVSNLFHSGIPYIVVSVWFMVVTTYGLYLLKDIRDHIKEQL